ncbi:helix-turn-helix transcriptional regulator [Glycomyces sp. NPDC047010]|uniref:helix-turn-helix transcriptional regulator n=1 Tax=Glycomyces sp. NPDC047010 TaxID=3155023 RepID=UPI0033DE42F2
MLRDRREELGFSQESLARAIGVETSTVWRWEHGETSPQPWLRPKLAVALEVNREQLTALLVNDDQPLHPSAAPAAALDAEMRRRTFLAGVPLLASALTPHSLGSLEVELSQLWASYQASRYGPIVDRLPGLLAQLQSSLIIDVGRDRRRCERALALAYQLSATALTKLGHRDPAMSALDLGIAAAERSSDLVVAGSVKRSKAHAMLAFGFPSESAGLVEETLAGLRAVRVHESPNLLSVLGTLHLVGSVASSQEGDRRGASASLEAAGAAASRLGRDANCLWTAFGPTNVAIHRIVTDIELGRPAKAIDLAPAIDTRSLPSERRARHAIEVARAHSLLGQIDEAAAVLIESEKSAAEQIRHHRLSRHLVASWLEGPRRRGAVSSLAERMRLQPD